MKRIFLCEDGDAVASAYGSAADGPVYNRAALIAAPKKFGDVEYVFSTWGMPQLSAEEIRRCLPRLRAVFYAAGTVQAFARPFLDCGVRVFSAWAANAVPVAEYTAAQIILANKGYFRTAALATAGQYGAAREEFSRYRGNYGAKIGIIGAGMVGRQVIRLLKNYRLDVLVFDPFLPDATAAELGVERASLERIFSECSVISNHLANNDQTRGMLNGRLFRMMPDHATFLNTGRGVQVVEEELIEALKARSDLTSILDVTFPEPPSAGSELYGLANCILTPHIAGSSGDEVRRMGEYMIAEYESFVQGEPCRYEVTRDMLATMA